jgi:uncharacterized membrane protein YgdD (TMEM256/DUF423 family)
MQKLSMSKLFLIIGTVLAGLAVVLGAFGAHGLKKIADAETLAIYQTAVQYQMYHALALILAGILAERFLSPLTGYAGFFFIGGVILFSGSLYLISSLKAMNKSIPTGVGILTPIGGFLFILGWVLLLVAIIKK